MKKILSIVLILVLSLFVFSFTAVAENENAPEISVQPQGFTISNDEIGTLKVEVAEYDGQLEYQWYKGTLENMSDASAISGATSAVYTPKNEIGTAYYQVGIIGIVFGEKSEEIKSNIVKVEYIGHEHSFGEWSTDVEATCTEIGKRVHTCECGETEAEDIPALGHKWGDSQITKKPTETETGEKVTICDVCKESKTESVPALGITDKKEETPEIVPPEKEETKKTAEKKAKQVKPAGLRWWMILFPAVAFILMLTAAIMIIRRYTRK